MTTVPDLFRLDDRVAVVTGASSGLGVAFAQGLAEAGADVVARRPPRRPARGDRRRWCAPRVAGSSSPRPTWPRRRTARRWSTPRWPSWVGSTSSSTTPESAPRCPATRETPEQFRRVIDVNLNGCYWMAQACGRVMQPGSSIVNVSSVLSLTTAGLPQAAYAASKAGLNGLTRDLAAAVDRPQGHPGQLRRPGVLRLGDDRPVPAGLPRVAAGADPRRAQGRAQELAATVVFLASPASGYITGQVLPVDGGMTIT